MPADEAPAKASDILLGASQTKAGNSDELLTMTLVSWVKIETDCSHREL